MKTIYYISKCNPVKLHEFKPRAKKTSNLFQSAYEMKLWLSQSLEFEQSAHGREAQVLHSANVD